MSFFNPEIPIKEKPVTIHPWEHRIKAKYSGRYKHAHNSTDNPVYPVPKAEDTLAESRRVKFIIIGNRVTKEFIYCQHVVKGLYKYRKKQFRAPIIRGVTSVEWPKVWNDLKLQFGRAAYCLKGQVAVLLDNEFLGGEEELRNVVETKYIYQYPEYLDYYKEGIEQFSNYVKSFGRPCAYLHICINDVPIGPLIFMLYADIAPLTCQNFINLCESKRGGYSGTPVHRIVQDGWIQCGGFGLDNQESLDCENYIVPHDRRGVLCMANDGRNKDCSTQFFVLLQPANWMKYKYVAFGQLIEGEKSLQKIENSPTWCESPTDKIIIYRTGVFNMECLWRPINRTANEYISGHIEDLVQLGILFYDIILENLYAALDEKLQALEDEETEVVKEIHPTKRAGTVKHVTAAAASENNEFDVEVYDEYEAEEGDSGLQDTYVLADETPKSSRILEKPYYLPLTDVPYPGEIESAFNLQRLLRGDYSLEADLIMDQEERKKEYTVREKLTVPEELLDALFEYFEPDVRSDTSLESDEEKTIKIYIKEHVDTTSFAGPIIKKMANLNAKYQLFEAEEDQRSKDFLTDEDLRLFRVAAKEMHSQRQKKVSISASTAMASHTCIQRRPTGFVRKEDIQMLDDIIGKFMENREEDEMDDIDREEHLRQVQIESNKASSEKGPIKRRQTGFVRPGDDEPRTSALLRLYDEVSMSDEEEVPTLKGFRPTSETHQNTYKYLTQSPLSLLEDKGDKVLIHRYDNDSLGDTLNLQHGKKLSRKMSSDYANTLSRLERPPNFSLRSIEYAKQRPSLSVVEYKQKNQKYQEEMGKFQALAR